VDALCHTELLADGTVHTFRLLAIAECAHAYAHSGGVVTYRSEPQFDRFPIGPPGLDLPAKGIDLFEADREA
jgi:hypothetical protein